MNNFFQAGRRDESLRFIPWDKDVTLNYLHPLLTTWKTTFSPGVPRFPPP
jgi:hypothetical protein